MMQSHEPLLYVRSRAALLGAADKNADCACVYRAKTICRKFKTCFLKKAPNVRYSRGISGILNQNSVNNEFVKGL